MAILIDGRIFLNHVGELPAQVNMQIFYKNICYVMKFFGWKSSPENFKYMTGIPVFSAVISIDGQIYSDHVGEDSAELKREISRGK